MIVRALITGATGFIGYHIARVLRQKGVEVRALVRSVQDSSLLTVLGVESCPGDLRDYGAVLAAMEGCNHVYHTAADYRLWVPDPSAMYTTNVKGTLNALRAAMETRVSKFVYTSTVGVLGQTENGGPGNENTPAKFQDLAGHYKKSKFFAEQEVRRFIDKGLPAVIVYPTAPIGAMDRKPTPTGKIIVDFLNGKIPAYLDTGLNFVDVEDVAEAHVLAQESGAVGEGYVLGNTNLTLKQFLDLLSRLTGQKPPRWKLPYTPVLCLAYMNQGLARLAGGRPPAIPLDGVRMARRYMFFDCSKATQKLGMAQTSIDRAAIKAIDWYKKNGYLMRRSPTGTA